MAYTFKDFLGGFNNNTIKNVITGLSNNVSSAYSAKSGLPAASYSVPQSHKSYSAPKPTVQDIQRTVNTINYNSSGYTPLKVDGVFGNKTQSAVNSTMKQYFPTQTNYLAGIAAANGGSSISGSYNFDTHSFVFDFDSYAKNIKDGFGTTTKGANVAAKGPIKQKANLGVLSLQGRKPFEGLDSYENKDASSKESHSAQPQLT